MYRIAVLDTFESGRLKYASEKLGEFFSTDYYNINKYDNEVIFSADIFYNAVILPVPYSEKNIPPETLKVFSGNPIILVGKPTESLTQYCLRNKLKLIDYYNVPGFAEKNALPTAKGTFDILKKEYLKSNYNQSNFKKTLILGYGRTGKACASYFANTDFFPSITVWARSDEALRLAKENNFPSIRANSEPKNFLSDFDIIINTVPCVIVSKEDMEFIRNDAVIIDLSSTPGFEGLKISDAKPYDNYLISYIGNRCQKIITAYSIPGKFAPEEAGEIIAEIILKLIEGEQNGEK